MSIVFFPLRLFACGKKVKPEFFIEEESWFIYVAGKAEKIPQLNWG